MTKMLFLKGMFQPACLDCAISLFAFVVPMSQAIEMATTKRWDMQNRLAQQSLEREAKNKQSLHKNCHDAKTIGSSHMPKILCQQKHSYLLELDCKWL